MRGLDDNNGSLWLCTGEVAAACGYPGIRSYIEGLNSSPANIAAKLREALDRAQGESGDAD